MTLDLPALRKQFPSLDSGIAHFDGPGGSQTPRPVGDAIASALCGPLSNRGDGVASERNSTNFVIEFREACADLLAASPLGIVHGRSATQLTMDFARHLAKTWGSGDEIVVTRLDHDSNIRPWILAAERVGATVRWVEFDPATAELDLTALAELVGPRTRLVAVTAASNLVGTMPPIARIAELAHNHGALLYVDGVHYTAHYPVDLPALGADFFVCSPYKFMGPHCGVLAADPALLETLRPDKLLPSTDEVPERFELGTLPYEQLAGVTAAVDFIAGIAPASGQSRRERIVASMGAVAAHEDGLRDLVEEGLASLGDAVTLHSRAAQRTPTLYLTLPGRRTWDAYEYLAARNVLAPAGSFYAIEAFGALRLDDSHGLRVGLAPYSEAAEVHRLIDGLAGFLRS
ncbi:MAG TPA: cysteine desulfurase-like protein [Pseudonocardia sp.]|nr:cysteine desulfurase-like protein [Pseudonocardia sp.]